MPITRPITTAEELWEAGDIGRCELVHGALHMMSPAGGEHGRIALRIAGLLFSYVEEHQLGTVYAAETGFILGDSQDTVRAPDVAFIRAERAAATATRKFIPGAPDFAVEVLSPDDRADYVRDKVRDWLDAGCRLLWVVDPATRIVRVHRPGAAPETFEADARLTGGEVVPGFELPVTEIFKGG